MTQVRVVHYLNQFFGQVGGEDKAHTAPFSVDGPVGPGRLLEQCLSGDAVVVGTVICGDNYFAEQQEEALATLTGMVEAHRPDLLIAGPAFGAGRYGVACAQVCAYVGARLDIPTVTGMDEENPGRVAGLETYIVRTGLQATDMRAAVTTMAALSEKLMDGVETDPDRDGFFPRGIRRNSWADATAATRAVRVLRARLNDEPFSSEIPLPQFDAVPQPPLLTHPEDARIALVTDGGIVAKGNPRKLPTGYSTTFSEIGIGDLPKMNGDIVDIVHHGYDNRFAREDPNRLIPLDACRRLEREGKIGKVHDTIFSTSGVATPLANAREIGRGIAAKLRSANVQAVILTST